MSRTFAARRRERQERIVERVQWLSNKLCRPDLSEGQRRHATSERSALWWALEELARLDAIEEALETHADDSHAIEAITMIMDARSRPTEEDMARAPQLARMYGEKD